MSSAVMLLLSKMNLMSWTTFIVITLIVHCHDGFCFRNFAVNKRAYQSSILTYNAFQWTADRAVDGNTNGSNPDWSRTCSATDVRLDNHTWEVDIGLVIIVKTITVYERSDGNNQLSGFQVFIGNNTRPWTVNQPLTEVQPENTQHIFRANDLLAQFISVIRQNKNILTICEVVVEGECQKGTYGDGCNKTCGNCIYGNSSCNTTDGQCMDGCQAGWRGATCKEECDKGTYGYGCNATCGMCLSGNNSCSISNGQCQYGCEAGWRGGTCKLGCDIGAYGYGCNETCGMCFSGNNSCSAIDGQCKDGCKAGWQGGTCKQGCDKGKYGYGCNETCGMCFSGNNSCPAIDGQCIDGCEAGWQGGTCKQGCDKGKHGYRCNETCGMCFSGNNSCSAIDGQCKVGCEAGWRGGTCKQGCDKGQYGYGCNETCGMCFSGNNSCSAIDGQCKVGCEAGWQGGTCKQGCDKGEYGYGCNETCGICFSGNNSCSSIDGQCKIGCDTGWRRENCKQECEKGTYGYGCNQTCGKCMHGNDSCSTKNGTCRDGCQEGWQDEKCILEVSMPPPPPENGIIIGVVVPVVIVIITVITLFVVLRVRRKRSKLKEVPAMPNQEQKAFHQVIQEAQSNDRQPQEIEELCSPKGLVYQNATRKTQLMAQCIPVLSFWCHVMKTKANKEECESEFQELTQGLTKTYDAALGNPSKNRYKSMYPYDFNRIVLKKDSTLDPEYENDSDYINASHIKGFEDQKCYIAAQGPINKTVDDFWWMVWQEETECIVMLTNLSEMGKVKCIQYWPDEAEHTYGDVTVKFLRKESFPDCIKRDLQIIVGGKSRKITQFHYKAWPDKDVPDTAWSLVEFWKAVRKHKTYCKGPMVVHCSAGIGRTGTFIALDIIYDETCETGEVAVMKCVENLREQRVNMVQTANQFMFLHDVVAEALGFGTMPVFKKQFSDVFRHLMEKDEKSGQTLLQRQYNMLMYTDLGRDESNVPVYSNAEGFQSESIWLPNLSGRDAYIVMRRVDDETLLATIRQRNIKCLIIADIKSPKDVLFSFGVNQSTTVAGLKISCKENEDLGAFERKQFSITSDEKTESHKLTIFLLKAWEESHDVPSDSNSVLSLLEDISQWHPSPSELNPVLLYTRWELNICGLMYTLLNEKDRIRRDGEIHILRTNADMLARSRALLPTFEQYVFVYKCLATDSLPESTYENTAGISNMREII